jgi:hypothetical protein
MATIVRAIAVLAFRFEKSGLHLSGVRNLLASVLVGAAIYSVIVFHHYRNEVKAWKEATAAAQASV